MRNRTRALAVLVAACVAVSLIAVAPAAARHGANGTVCMVLDPAGPDDGGYNAGAVAGLEKAQRKLHVDAVVAESATEAEILANLDAFVMSGDCDLIIGVGFVVGFEMGPFVDGNPAQRFAVIDSMLLDGSGEPYPNAANVLFAPNEAAFLAGYIAAGISKTGKVGTYGGLPIPPVTDFMYGYEMGVEYYNDQHGAAVEVLGLDLFSFTFSDPVVGNAIGQYLMDAGADSIMPAAGFTGFGTLQAIQARKAAGEPFARFVGVDVDAYEAWGDPMRVILTSVLKKTDVAVYHQVEALVDGTWAGGEFVEDLASNGVDIAKFHKLNRDVPGYLKKDLKKIRKGIINGTIATLP